MDMFSNAALEREAARRRPAPLQPARRPRLLWLDAARGAAVVAMAFYHTSWDLSWLRLVETVVTTEPAWSVFARAIAATFLILAGLGLVLAHGGGIRWDAFRRRLVAVAAAALAITAATWFVFPDSYIFFGVLHHIALASILALPFLRRPFWAAALTVPVVWTVPLWLTQPVFDWPPLAFLGLGAHIPDTNDWVPVFPWFGFVLVGIAAGKILERFPSGVDGTQTAEAGRASRPTRALAWLGRHSLIIYLLHQPLIFGALAGMVAVTGPNPVAEAAPFLRSCETSCRAADQPAALCRATCACTVAELKRDDLWRSVVANRLAPEDSRRMGALARTCLARSRPDPD